MYNLNIVFADLREEYRRLETPTAGIEITGGRKQQRKGSAQSGPPAAGGHHPCGGATVSNDTAWA